jgi:IS5 family transposase
MEQHVWADSGYRGAQNRVDREDLQWHIAARPSDMAKLPEGRRKAVARKRERRKASVRAKVEQRPGRMSTFDARTRDRRSGAGRTTQPGKEEG